MAAGAGILNSTGSSSSGVVFHFFSSGNTCLTKHCILRSASSNGIPLAVIAGESEFKENSVTVKDLRTRKQDKVPRSELVAYVRQKLSEGK